MGGDVYATSECRLRTPCPVTLIDEQKAADNLESEIAQLNNMTSRLYRRTDFYTQHADHALPGQRLTQADMDIVIKFLERDRRILSTRLEVIKLHASPLQGKERQDVSDIDVNVLDVKKTESALLDQIADLEKRIAEWVDPLKASLC